MIIELLNEFWKFFYGSFPKKDFIKEKSVVKVWKLVYVWTNVFFQIFSWKC